ncbi:MAG: GYD domain-containing protein [Conexivisphaerales archaeon]
MYFVTLVKFRKKLTKQDFAEEDKLEKEFAKKGLKVKEDFYTLGRYDNIMVIEAPDEKTVASFLLKQSHIVNSETLAAIPKSEGRKLVG